MSLFARIPTCRFPILARLRRNSNKAIMFMLQTHMLHKMFVTDPPWTKPDLQPSTISPGAPWA
jgi:hypothetical protein